MTKISGKDPSHGTQAGPTATASGTRSLFSPPADLATDPEVRAAIRDLFSLEKSSFETKRTKANLAVPPFKQVTYGSNDLSQLDDGNDERLDSRADAKGKSGKAGKGDKNVSAEGTRGTITKSSLGKGRR